MTALETKLALKSLAQSQGLYGRIIDAIEQSSNPEKIYAELGEDCKDILDLVFKIEV
jgi:hypothetical protein